MFGDRVVYARACMILGVLLFDTLLYFVLVCMEPGKIRISTFLEDVPDAKIPLSHNSKRETGMVGLKNQVTHQPTVPQRLCFPRSPRVYVHIYPSPVSIPASFFI